MGCAIGKLGESANVATNSKASVSGGAEFPSAQSGQLCEAPPPCKPASVFTTSLDTPLLEQMRSKSEGWFATAIACAPQSSRYNASKNFAARVTRALEKINPFTV
jgi:hypothetical protein